MNIFRELRKSRKLTQKQLADMLYLDQTTVSKWELGKATPDYGTLQKLADFYGVTTDLLLNRNDTTRGEEKHDAQSEIKIDPALSLSEKELIMLKEFRTLLPEMQDLVITMIKNLHSEKVKV